MQHKHIHQYTSWGGVVEPFENQPPLPDTHFLFFSHAPPYYCPHSTCRSVRDRRQDV